jgi:hypothetical protein
MSDEPLALPSPGPETPPPAPPPPPRRQGGRTLVPWIYALGFVVLAFALIWMWQNPTPPPNTIRLSQFNEMANQITALGSELHRLEGRISAPPPNLQPVQQQLAALSSRIDKLPKPTGAPDLGPLQKQVSDLQAQVSHIAAPDLQPLEQRVAALDQQLHSLPPPPDLRPLQAELANQQKLIQDLEQLPTQLQTAAQQRAALSSRLDSLAAEQQALGKRLDDLTSTVKSQTGTFDQKVAAIEQQATQVAAAVKSATRLAQLEAARSALIAGQKLGNIPGAPPALARFADTPPPTEADLRLTYPAAVKAALDASGNQPPSGATFGARVLNRAQNLITIREGDRVLVGDPTAGILASAKTKLDAGDLSGAVAELSKLSGPPAQAMAPWLDKAKALLAARDALNDMTAHA